MRQDGSESPLVVVANAGKLSHKAVMCEPPDPCRTLLKIKKEMASNTYPDFWPFPDIITARRFNKNGPANQNVIEAAP